MRRLAATLLLFSLIAPGCSAKRPDPLFIGPRALGGLAVEPATPFRQVRRFFGSPDSVSFGWDDCRLRFRKIGLLVHLSSLDERTGTPATCRFLFYAVATTPRWRTARGLRVGATESSLLRAYPHAFRCCKVGGEHWGLPAGTVDWWLGEAAHSGHAAHMLLNGYVKRGRVVALGLSVAGH